jgi:hypothetical protein
MDFSAKPKAPILRLQEIASGNRDGQDFSNGVIAIKAS